MEKYNSDDIQSLSAGEHVKIRPELYFKECFEQNSLNIIPFEFLCHAFDEFFDGNKVEITITLKDKVFLIAYNCGISLEKSGDGLSKAERIMTELYACRNEKKYLSVGDKYCNLGIAILNFASSYCILKTCHKNKIGTFKFENGITVFSEIENSNSEDFTSLEVLPNYELLKNLRFDAEGISKIADQINSELDHLNIVVNN